MTSSLRKIFPDLRFYFFFFLNFSNSSAYRSSSTLCLILTQMSILSLIMNYNLTFSWISLLFYLNIQSFLLLCWNSSNVIKVPFYYWTSLFSKCFLILSKIFIFFTYYIWKIESENIWTVHNSSSIYFYDSPGSEFEIMSS